jgi:methylated-DNA-protein-cysteine methyltransferase related protein
MNQLNSMEKNNFFANVYDVVREVPRGRVTTYGAIAHYLGLTRSARMVGWAMNAAHSLPDVPAHRVVNRNGILTGKHHFSTQDAMQLSLEEEGVLVIDDRIQNFNQVYWDPSDELHVG